MITNINKIFVNSKTFKDKSKIKIELHDEFIRKYKRSKFFYSKYYISISQFFIFNQFNNISFDVNDKIQFFTSSHTFSEDIVDISNIVSFSLLKSFRLDEGNPNPNMIVQLFNSQIKAFGIEISFERYTNKFIFKNTSSNDIYLHPSNSKLVYGFKSENLYKITASSQLHSEVMINLAGDTLLMFNLSPDSDIKLKNTCYNNIGKSKFELGNIFHIIPIDTITSGTLTYNRNDCLDKSEIVFDKTSLRSITLEIFNQDYDRSDISDWFLEFEIIEVQYNKFMQLIIIFFNYLLQLMK